MLKDELIDLNERPQAIGFLEPSSQSFLSWLPFSNEAITGVCRFVVFASIGFLFGMAFCQSQKPAGFYVDAPPETATSTRLYAEILTKEMKSDGV